MSAAERPPEPADIAARRRLSNLRSLPVNWDEEGAPQPSKHAIDRADAVLELLSRDGIPMPDVFARPDGGIVLSWRPITPKGVVEIEARLGDDGDQVQIGYAHLPGFELDEDTHTPIEIVKLVRDRFYTLDR